MGELVKVTFTRRFPALALSGNLPFLGKEGECCSLSLETLLCHLGNVLPCHRKGKLLCLPE